MSGGDRFEEGSAAALIAELNAVFDQTPFTQLKSALLDHETFEHVNAAIGPLGEFLNRFIDPEIVLDFTNTEALAIDQDQIQHGQEGWTQIWRVYLTPWSDFEIVDSVIEPIDRHRALTRATWRFTGEHSGVRLEVPNIGLWKVRDGRGVRVAQYDNVEDAHAALELPEWQPDSG